jgi:uncharacterized protein
VLPGCGVNLDIRQPLRLNVGFLLHRDVGFSRNFDFDGIGVKLSDDLEVRNLRGSIRFTRTAQGLVGQGKFEAEASLECVRCLTPFDQTLEIKLDDLFVYPPDRATDPLLAVPETGILDLTPLTREYLILDTPLQPVCNSDCKGLCPECGNNLNEQSCQHGQSEVDPRLAVLKDLLHRS